MSAADTSTPSRSAEHGFDAAGQRIRSAVSWPIAGDPGEQEPSRQLGLLLLATQIHPFEEMGEGRGRQIRGAPLSFVDGENASALMASDHVSYLVQDDRVLVEPARVLAVGDHIVVGVGPPGSGAFTRRPAHWAQVDGSAAMGFEPVEKLVDVPGVRQADIPDQPAYALLALAA